ncbi:MAG: alpha-1,2-fucosyltransferase, partial [Alphaproteobacteria bacterium]|nr:alpha-1,2-fucosyltransferase [Alphaproteobacteria bacterium]
VPLRLDITRFENYKVWPYALNALQVPQDIASADDLKALRIRPSCARRFLRRLGRLKSEHLYVEPHYHYDEAFDLLGPETYLSGYFQSARYFESCADALRERFAPRVTPDDETLTALRAADVPISLHVRRGDYLSNPVAAAVHGSTQLAYYERAVEILTRLVTPAVPTFFIFSDDQEWVRQNIAFCPKAVYVNGRIDKPQDDIWLMSQCHHHIIANSSFSWWGAWLNAREDKKVVAPRRWFAPKELITKNTRDLYPEGWILL